MITSNSFVKEYNKFAKALVRRIKAYVKDPNAENVHRLRTTIRRYQAAFRLLPKAVRRRKKSENALARVKKLMRVNAKVRDIDITLAKLSSYKSSAYDSMITGLRESRKTNLNQAEEIALAVQKNPGTHVKLTDLPDRILRRRYDKIVRRLASKITSELPLVREDSSKVEELHVVRRDCKQLRYVLEMSEFSKPPKSLVALRSWQDLLGTIRDSDVAIAYLQRLTRSPQIQLALNKEIENRERSYRKFVEVSRENLVSSLSSI